jgi:hypothetical protein
VNGRSATSHRLPPRVTYGTLAPVRVENPRAYTSATAGFATATTLSSGLQAQARLVRLLVAGPSPSPSLRQPSSAAPGLSHGTTPLSSSTSLYSTRLYLPPMSIHRESKPNRARNVSPPMCCASRHML